jgi:D-sedoheptulose 7-phosphate isomerase
MQFLNDYFSEYKKLAFSDGVQETIKQFKELAETVKKSNSKMMFAGNGASAAISAHGAVDFTKQGGVRGITFNEADLITCFANDFGYENWIAQAIEHYYDENDVVVLISVSGTSPSVVNAAKKAKELGLKVVTFTGRHIDNDLRAYADVDFWVDSHAYNIVECIHMICSVVPLIC